MNKSTDKIQKAQELLYDWISHFDKRSLESIKKNCDYLNNIYELQLTNPIWGITLLMLRKSTNKATKF